MSNIQIICDSTGGFSKEELQKLDVELLSLNVNYPGGSIVEGTRDTFPAYYDLLKTLPELPTTSQPPVGEIYDLFRSILDGGKDIIAICLSEGLSGTYNAFCTAAKMLDESRISIVDSRSCSVNVKYLARIARNMIDQGYARLEIEQALKAQADRNGAIMFVEELKFLKKGGRVNNLAFVVGKLLSIRPILKMQDGILIACDKVRGLQRAAERLMAELPDKLKFITVLHCDNEPVARSCVEKLRTRFANMLIELEDLSPVIGTHLGNGSVGIIYCWD